MKLSFTTLGCPDWDLDTILTRAVEYGFDAVDFRGYQEEMTLYRRPEFSTQAQQTASRFKEAGLEVSCFSSSARLVVPREQRPAFLEEVQRYAELCAIFGTRIIRVFGGALGGRDRESATALAAEFLQQMAEAVQPQGVTIVVETHDDWTRAEHVKALFDLISAENVGVLWDVHHPYRTVGEAPTTTWQLLGPWIRYTHWKDSKRVDSGHRYCLFGEGDIPLREIAQILIQGGYQGYFTLEWEKRWHPELEAPEVVFPQYVQFMRQLVA